MATISSLDMFLDPVNGCLTPQVVQRIVDWRPDEATRKRIEELGRKADEGTLTSDEDAEYREYIDEGDVMRCYKPKRAGYSPAPVAEAWTATRDAA